MRPSSTSYRLARPGGEYNKLYAMMQRNGFPKLPLGWPVVVAERDGEVIGFLGTKKSDETFEAGPLVIDGGSNPFLFIRLVEAYENALRICRIRAYWFSVARSNLKQVARVKALGMNPVHETPEAFVFKRELQ